jgi:hypothetical protein
MKDLKGKLTRALNTAVQEAIAAPAIGYALPALFVEEAIKKTEQPKL